MFGGEVYWSVDRNQAQGIKHCLIHETPDLHKLKMPDVKNDRLMPFEIK
jgi:hypothetical protein